MSPAACLCIQTGINRAEGPGKQREQLSRRWQRGIAEDLHQRPNDAKAKAPGCGMWGAALQKTTYGAGRYWGDAGILEQTTDSEDEDQEGLEDESISAYLMEGYLEEGRRRLGQHLTDTQLLDEAALSRCPPPSPTSEASQKRRAPDAGPLSFRHRASSAMPGPRDLNLYLLARGFSSVSEIVWLCGPPAGHFRPAALGGFANTADKVSLRLNKDLAATGQPQGDRGPGVRGSDFEPP